MSIKFEKNAYLRAVKENETFNEDQKIFEHAKESLKFKYVDVNYQKFAEICSDELWLGRKLVALPAAAFCATLKTIYHLAEAILIGCLKALSDDGKYCQAKFFSIGRDFQEAFGRLVTLLNDKKGQFYIQESRFHQTCYKCALSGREIL